MYNTAENSNLTNPLEQKSLSDIFAAGGFYSGASFRFMSLENQLYPSWANLRKNSPSFREFTLNNKTLSLFDFNPINLYKEYKNTQEYCKKTSTLEDFNFQIQESQPKIVMGHSMGCQLIENWLCWLQSQNLEIPSSIERIIYYQSDSRTVSNPMIENHYSPVDPMLIISTIVNGSTPIGLVPDTKHLSNVPLHPSILRAARRILPVDLHIDTINALDHREL
jgi:Lecithin:cholesterol acyltransferase